MKIVKFKTEDVTPIVAAVLALSGMGMISLIFRIALEGEYDQLKGKFDSFEPTQEMAKLVEELDDEASQLLRKFSKKIYALLSWICKTYHIHLEKLLESTEYTATVHEIFYTYTIFTREETGGEDTGYAVTLNDMMLYLYSLRGLYSAMYAFLETGKITMETDEVYWEWYIYMPHAYLFEGGHQHDVSTRLSAITRKLERVQQQLTEP
ncbi:hypothetical protein ACSBL2_17135 [Pedobacter sp. AW31-3R]|uniref:hypothetical protein n=1 Tax=Pedobacter sp. AW31-3R TaxID=3445781 RepID=UPI003F9FA620